VRRGVHVISIAEEMTFPEYRAPQAAVEIDRLAATHNVSVLGTGINPGFVLDLLVVALSGVCAEVRSISATRINDLSAYGPTVLAKQGVGLAPEAFRAGLADGSVVGHIGFPESIHMIGRALGWRIARIEEQREPIVAQVRRATPFVTVEPGHVAGCRHTAVGYMGSEPVITLTHPQQIQAQREGVETGDTIEIRGTPHVRLAGSPEIPGGIATASLAVNMVPRILDAPPGLHCMTDLPVPAALLGGGTSAAGASAHVPLEMRVKGFLAEPAAVGAQAEIMTAARRRLRGTVVEINPAYTHGFGAPVPELTTIGDEVRTILRQRGRGR
jgi:4-hydroxy-tetrahydrodipicolinate reductase